MISLKNLIKLEKNFSEINFFIIISMSGVPWSFPPGAKRELHPLQPENTNKKERKKERKKEVEWGGSKRKKEEEEW